MAMERSLSIKVPQGMLDRIDREIELGEYSSRSDFVKAAIRIHLQQLQDSRRSYDVQSDAPTEIAAGGGAKGPPDPRGGPKRWGGGGGATPLEDDFVRQHIEGFCGSEIFDVIQMHLRRRGVI